MYMQSGYKCHLCLIAVLHDPPLVSYMPLATESTELAQNVKLGAHLLSEGFIQLLQPRAQNLRCGIAAQDLCINRINRELQVLCGTKCSRTRLL